MAKLGDAFSDDERRKSVARQLLPGTVIYLEVAFPYAFARRADAYSGCAERVRRLVCP